MILTVVFIDKVDALATFATIAETAQMDEIYQILSKRSGAEKG